jgi:hypothetical protein
MITVPTKEKGRRVPARIGIEIFPRSGDRDHRHSVAIFDQSPLSGFDPDLGACPD